LPERLALERAALGADFRCADEVINLPSGADRETIFANFTALRERAELLARKVLPDLPEESRAWAAEAVEWVVNHMDPNYLFRSTAVMTADSRTVRGRVIKGASCTASVRTVLRAEGEISVL
jgi:hypothetical protein